MKLLKEYQSEHPEDKDLQNAMAEIEGKKPAVSVQAPAQASKVTAPIPTVKAPAPSVANAKPRSFSLAG